MTGRGAALALAAAAALAAGAAVAAGGADAGADAAEKATVKIVFQTVPPENAVVMWGRKPLGQIRGARRPLVVERPRDSGPLDVVVRVQGYLPVHTRAYTFSDSRVVVKLTRVADKRTLFGYREEPPDGGAPDGGRADAGAPDR